MKCPNCFTDNNAVIDSRSRNETQKRIRRCQNCGYSFRTIEKIYPKGRITEKPLPTWYTNRMEKEMEQ